MSVHISGYNQFSTTASLLSFYAALKLDRQGLRLLWCDTNNSILYVNWPFPKMHTNKYLMYVIMRITHSTQMYIQLIQNTFHITNMYFLSLQFVCVTDYQFGMCSDECRSVRYFQCCIHVCIYCTFIADIDEFNFIFWMLL